MGMLVLLDSKPGPVLREEQKTRLNQLCDEATDVLQRSMFQMLGGTKETAALPTAWIDLDDAHWRVYGINEEWEKVTGVGMDVLDQFPGLLSVVMPADGGDSSLMRERAVKEATTKLKLGDSLPLIISPKSIHGCPLQFPVGLRQVDANDPADVPSIHSSVASSTSSASASWQSSSLFHSSLPSPTPSAPSSDDGTSSTTSGDGKRRNIWKIEIHARLQAKSYHTSSGDLDIPMELTSSTSASGSIRRSHSSSRFSRSAEEYLTPPQDGSKDVSTTPTGVLMPEFHSEKPFGISSVCQSRRSSLSLVPSRHFSPRITPRMGNLYVGEMLGTGAYANVYAGVIGDRPVAIKMIMLPAGSDCKRQSWLGSYEAMMAVDNSHDNIVETLDWCEVDNGPAGKELWIIQELCSEGSLWGAIKAGKFLKPGANHEQERDYRAMLQAAREVARGMRYMHSMHDLHGDLSSNNVLLASANNSRRWVAKVSDFGLSRLSAHGASECATETVGTVSFMSPELLMDGVLTQSADVYSFGVILWELWCGKRAWGEFSIGQTLFAVTCRGDTLKIPENAPAEYAALMKACLSPDRSKRPSFSEIVPRIDAMLSRELSVTV